eukprot:TRINITY_DN6352_c0_g1_i2.p1 TRINITY_DN6352_c0_g1~~TRINITY_DN6352_c0_g1_i2.p1  ORF type:complete len:137 (-),score=38.40 TRINITY_DN6352_c0_g1_i2:120-530(-)
MPSMMTSSLVLASLLVMANGIAKDVAAAAAARAARGSVTSRRVVGRDHVLLAAAMEKGRKPALIKRAQAAMLDLTAHTEEDCQRFLEKGEPCRGVSSRSAGDVEAEYKPVPVNGASRLQKGTKLQKAVLDLVEDDD